MPIIPQYQRKVVAPPVEQPEIPLSFGQAQSMAMSQTGGQAADFLFKFDEKLNEAAKVQKLIELKVDSSKRMLDLYDQTVTSPEFNVSPEEAKTTFERRLEELKSEYLPSISDRVVRNHFDEHWGTKSLQFSSQIRTQAREQRLRLAKGSLMENLDELTNLVGRSKTPAELADFTRQGLGAIQMQVQQGVIHPDDGVKLKRQFNARNAELLLNRDIRQDPIGALDKLLAGVHDKYLDEPTKERLTKRAQDRADSFIRHTDAELARQESREERERKKILDRTEMDLWARMSPGRADRPSIQELDDYREKRLLDSNGYNSLRRALTEKEEGVEIPSIALELEDKVLTGQGDRNEILRLAGKSISHDTAGKLLSKIREVERQDDISKTPVYREAYNFVKSQLTTTGPLESLNQDDESRRAFALREFDQRARKGEDLWSVADEVTKRGKKAQPSAAFFLKPRYLEGPETDLGALDRAEQVTVEKLRSGELTVDLFKIEMEAVSQYKKAAVKRIEDEKTDKETKGKFKRR